MWCGVMWCRLLSEEAMIMASTCAWELDAVERMRISGRRLRRGAILANANAHQLGPRILFQVAHWKLTSVNWMTPVVSAWIWSCLTTFWSLHPIQPVLCKRLVVTPKCQAITGSKPAGNSTKTRMETTNPGTKGHSECYLVWARTRGWMPRPVQIPRV